MITQKQREQLPNFLVVIDNQYVSFIGHGLMVAQNWISYSIR